MTHRLQGKTAFITAAGQGIGRAAAEAFVREGARDGAADAAPPARDDRRLALEDARAHGSLRCHRGRKVIRDRGSLECAP